MSKIKKITIVTAQGVNEYEVGCKYANNEKVVDRIERTCGYTDFYGKYVGGYYSALDKFGRPIATITDACPMVVEYF